MQKRDEKMPGFLEFVIDLTGIVLGFSVWAMFTVAKAILMVFFVYPLNLFRKLRTH